WSIGITVLALLHLYYFGVIFSLVTIAVAVAGWDLADIRTRVSTNDLRQTVATYALWIFVVFNAITLLVTVVLWGNAFQDNDPLGSYMGYYESVLNLHSNGPNLYFVHYFHTKGH